MIMLSLVFITAQTAEKCATDNLLKSAIQKDPSIIQKMAVSEAKLQEYMKAHANEKSGVVYTIPIVIHIIHNGEPIGEGSNISDEQIYSQIDRLNEDFRNTNADALDTAHPYYPIQADVEIEFCLASIDPEGNIASGIYRYNLQQPGWDRTSIDSFIKPLTIWNRYDYMNIWSINIDDPNSPGVDGYGTFPASTTDSTDGLVIAYTSFGTVDGEKFITGTHEVGHYFNLHHVWGDNQPNCGDDLVDDTPPSAEPNFGCPDFPHNPNDTCGTGPNGDIYMNFMDYADAVCTVMFTAGQKDRMRATLETERASLLTSNGCFIINATEEKIADHSFEVFPNPSNGNFTIKAKSGYGKNTSIGLYNFLGTEIMHVEKVERFPYDLNLNNLPDGTYFIKLKSGNDFVTKKILITK